MWQVRFEEKLGKYVVSSYMHPKESYEFQTRQFAMLMQSYCNRIEPAYNTDSVTLSLSSFENGKLFTHGQPELSKWQGSLFGGQFKFNPVKSGEPKWFHRKMMTLFFGVKWVKMSSVA